uniref:Uncharacterized protein n=1 Tax=Triticum urartu TaxID=4572 RepID=A0A8R7QMS9_TRIUA
PRRRLPVRHLAFSSESSHRSSATALPLASLITHGRCLPYPRCFSKHSLYVRGTEEISRRMKPMRVGGRCCVLIHGVVRVH